MHAVVKSFKRYIVEGRFVSLFVSFVIIVMRAAMFSRVDTLPAGYSDTGYLWQYIAHWFDEPMVSHASSTLSVFLIAGLISAMNHRFTLIRSRSSLPFIAPLFLLSLHPWFMVMRADYIAVIFVLLAFFPLLRSYQLSNDTLFSFRSAILIGIASLFQIYALVLLPLWWQGERSMRGPHFRSFLSSLFGLSLVYISLFAQYFLGDNVSGFVRPFLFFADFSLPQLPAFSMMEWGAVALAGLFFISNMVLSTSVYSRDKVLTLSYMRFVVFLVTLQLLLQILYWKETLFFLTLSIALISYLNAYFYTRTQSPVYIYLALLIVMSGLLFYLSHFF